VLTIGREVVAGGTDVNVGGGGGSRGGTYGLIVNRLALHRNRRTPRGGSLTYSVGTGRRRDRGGWKRRTACLCFPLVSSRPRVGHDDDPEELASSLVDGDDRGRPNTMWDALGGLGGAESDDATKTMAVENRIRRHRRPSLMPLLVLLLLLL